MLTRTNKDGKKEYLVAAVPVTIKKEEKNNRWWASVSEEFLPDFGAVDVTDMAQEESLFFIHEVISKFMTGRLKYSMKNPKHAYTPESSPLFKKFSEKDMDDLEYPWQYVRELSNEPDELHFIVFFDAKTTKLIYELQ